MEAHGSARIEPLGRAPARQHPENFQLDYQYYIPRVDSIYLNSKGSLQIANGIPSEITLRPPAVKSDGMSLGSLYLPVYQLYLLQKDQSQEG